jgi:hypothetical protein
MANISSSPKDRNAYAKNLNAPSAAPTGELTTTMMAVVRDHDDDRNHVVGSGMRRREVQLNGTHLHDLANLTTIRACQNCIALRTKYVQNDRLRSYGCKPPSNVHIDFGRHLSMTVEILLPSLRAPPPDRTNHGKASPVPVPICLPPKPSTETTQYFHGSLRPLQSRFDARGIGQ